MAHFLKPVKAPPAGYQVRSDKVLVSVKIDRADGTKKIVLWGGARGGKPLQFYKGGAIDAKGRRIARIDGAPELEKDHKPDPDRDHEWYFIYTLQAETEGVGTLTAVDAANMPYARLQVTVGRGDIKVSVAEGTVAAFKERSADFAVSTASFPKSAFESATKLSPGPCKADVMKLRLKVEKSGAIFWVAAHIPRATTDFTRAYIFFHPKTIVGVDDASYVSFSKRWLIVDEHFDKLGAQMGNVLPMVLFVPFMRSTADANKATTNLFAWRGIDTLNEMLEFCAHEAGQRMTGPVEAVGVASFSSGVDHMATFAANVGASGIIKEQIDLDGPFIGVQHKTAPKLKSAKNIVITQVARPPPAVNWFHLPVSAWYTTDKGDPTVKDKKAAAFTVHQDIGNYTFRAAMNASVFNPKKV